jgi:hypothetical protein
MLPYVHDAPVGDVALQIVAEPERNTPNPPQQTEFGLLPWLLAREICHGTLCHKSLAGGIFV